MNQSVGMLVLGYPQGLKPRRFFASNGTAEAVPFQNLASSLHAGDVPFQNPASSLQAGEPCLSQDPHPLARLKTFAFLPLPTCGGGRLHYSRRDGGAT